MRGLPMLLLFVALGCENRQKGGETSPTSPAPRISRSLPAGGVTRVILRASAAAGAEVTVDSTTTEIEVSGQPSGGGQGYHSPDPNWRETPPAKWGFDFEAKRHGDVLVVSTKGEIEHIHHHYSLTGLTVRVPPGVEVVRETRPLTGDGVPNLAPPNP